MKCYTMLFCIILDLVGLRSNNISFIKSSCLTNVKHTVALSCYLRNIFTLLHLNSSVFRTNTPNLIFIFS